MQREVSRSNIVVHRLITNLCWRPSRLVASFICYLLDHASVHEISALVTWFQCMSDIFSHYGDLDMLYIFIMENLIYYILYAAMTTHVIFCIMPIHGHCTLMYLGLLYLLAMMCKVWSLYCIDWMASSSTGFFITSFLGWTYNVFRPSYDPSDPTH